MECASTGCSIRQIIAPETALGIDVGEDFIDLALLARDKLLFHRIPLAGIERAPLEILQKRLVEHCPEIGPGWLALIDSPRSPLDLNLFRSPPRPRPLTPRSRRLDAALRTLMRARRPPISLSLFPTPRIAYFADCAAAQAKPHLTAAFMELFGRKAIAPRGRDTEGQGGIFTRFMLIGFLTFCAVEGTGATAIEAYPDLQFRLWSRKPLPPKRAGRPAFAARRRVLARLRGELELKPAPRARTLDQADAEILVSSCALTARSSELLCLEHEEEGGFLLAAPDQEGAFSTLFRPRAGHCAVGGTTKAGRQLRPRSAAAS